MFLWADIEVRQREHEQYLTQLPKMRRESSWLALDRWQWRAMSRVGGWLIEAGCRLQTRVEMARHVMRASQIAIEGRSNSTSSCP